MNYLLAIYRKIVPEKLRATYNKEFQKLRIAWINRRGMERKKYGTLNKDKTFYVIRTDSTQHWGLGTTCTMVLNNIKYAVNKGWIPVIDYKNHYLFCLQEEKDRGKENAWEYYFAQPDSNYSLEEVYKSKNVILGPIWGQPAGSLSWSNIDDIYDEKYDIYFELTRQYIRINHDVLENAEKLRKELFAHSGNKKILGVGIRAGLYWGEIMKAETYRNHPEGLSIEEYIEQTRKYMKKFDCEYIFVSCDDRFYLERMKQEFREKCLYINDRELIHFFDVNGNPNISIKEREAERKNEYKMKTALDYIAEIYLLSKCDSLIAGKGGGAMLACLLNNKAYNHYCILKKDIIQ